MYPQPKAMAVAETPAAAGGGKFYTLIDAHGARNASRPRCRISAVTPGGFDQSCTGSPWLRNITPPKHDGMNPLENIVFPPLGTRPAVSTT